MARTIQYFCDRCGSPFHDAVFIKGDGPMPYAAAVNGPHKMLFSGLEPMGSCLELCDTCATALKIWIEMVKS